MKIHFIGVAGALTAGVARLAQEMGHEVSGSDRAFDPPMGDVARALGIPLFDGYEADIRSRPADCYVVGNAVSRGNPLLESVLSSRSSYISAAAWAAQNVMRRKSVVAVAGTHGKTTTSALLAWILECAGMKPGFLLGGVPPNFGTPARAGAGEWFVAEADEYDTAFDDKRPKFMHYRPRIAVLNNLEFDHADIYRDAGEIIRQFHYLLRTVPADGCVIARAGDANLQAAIAQGAYSPVSYFGGPEDSSEWKWHYDGREMTILQNGAARCRLVSPLPGAANRDNILAAAAAAHHAGADIAGLGEWLRDFKPPLRRLQRLADANGVVVYDDFAHHPTACRRTLEALRETHSDRRMIAVFEPRSNTMKAGIFQKEIAAAFAIADRVIAVGEMPWLDSALRPIAKKASCFSAPEFAAAVLRKELLPGDCVVIMSNGAFGGLPQSVAQIVRELNSETSAKRR